MFLGGIKRENLYELGYRNKSKVLVSDKVWEREL